ncbi:Protein CBG23784 [Caenorhabditis briggsae]|uniref:Protein CBG23784 n=1 Tax=Caenorhabditis briggsae TaxID=6238 RepID=A8WJA0_CAEBR|nr:Protein CBG23784 [Caenorhabditis briggsae]CAP20543.2 Protein CBG23784 [Caenorhabditis briggsae]
MRATWLLLIVVVTASESATSSSSTTQKPTTTTISAEIRNAKLPQGTVRLQRLQTTKIVAVLKNAPWECGTDEFTKSISEGEIMAKCPKLRDHWNSCCYQHDNCYDAQSGQQFCDDTFCSCLERRSRSSKSCHDESAPLFCDLVRTFGEDAYIASAPNATTTTESTVEKDDYDYESHVLKNATSSG